MEGGRSECGLLPAALQGSGPHKQGSAAYRDGKQSTGGQAMGCSAFSF